MASRLFSRSKTLTLARLLRPSSAPIDSNAAAAAHSCQFLRPLNSLPSPAFPDPKSAGGGSTPLPDPTISLLGSAGKIWGHGTNLQRSPFTSANAGFQSSTRWFSLKAEVGEIVSQPDISENSKNVECSKALAFSPLEATLTTERKTALWNESVKVKRMELSNKLTYALIPALLVISKSTLTTSVLVLSVYWQIYGFFKEIFLDYVHHEVTQKWVLIYFKLLLIILAKDTILDFDLA